MFEQKRQRFEKGLENIKASLSKPRGNKKTRKIYERIGRLKEKYPGIAAAYAINIEENMKILIKICTRPILKVSQIYKAMQYKSVPFYRKKTYLDF